MRFERVEQRLDRTSLYSHNKQAVSFTFLVSFSCDRSVLNDHIECNAYELANRVCTPFLLEALRVFVDLLLFLGPIIRLFLRLRQVFLTLTMLEGHIFLHRPVFLLRRTYLPVHALAILLS